MEQNIEALLDEMSTEEKITLISGADFSASRPIDRLGIPSTRMSDGPHGIRAQEAGKEDHLGLNASAAATCFPTGVALASSWNTDLIAEIGRALALEARSFEIQVLLGPAFNIKRSPLCGRNFEYYSEDPYLSSKLAASYIRAMQSVGVAACPKHFVCNNQEDRRMISNSVVDERTLREIYLLPFELAVKEGRPWAMMCAYNRLNGVPCSENGWLLHDILRREWGFDGAVISDWGAVSDRTNAAANGVDMEMLGTAGYSDTVIRHGLRSGELSQEMLDNCAENMLRLIQRTTSEGDRKTVIDFQAHHALAAQAAEECLVLLKNERQVLPLKPSGKLAILGAMAKHTRSQGGGSSHVASWRVDCALDCIKECAGQAEVYYAPGYDIEDDSRIDEGLLLEATALAKQADQVLVFVGLSERNETEGSDRSNMRLPRGHNELVERVLDVCPNAVVILTVGAPVELPWVSRVRALLCTYTAGNGQGRAVAKVIFGAVNPSGKLAETFPTCIEHTPAFLNFREKSGDIFYAEQVFVGYRWYEKRKLPVLFPFGHGLSYTRFEYSNLVVDRETVEAGEILCVCVNIKNVGSMAGKETVQLYIGDLESSVMRPVKELKGFSKVFLSPGEMKTVTFHLDRRAFAYYDARIHRWTVESGQFDLCMGASSDDIRLRKCVTVLGDRENCLTTVTKETTFGELVEDPRTNPLICRYLSTSPMYRPGEMQDAPDFLRNLPLWTLNHMAGYPVTPELLERYIGELNNALA